MALQSLLQSSENHAPGKVQKSKNLQTEESGVLTSLIAMKHCIEPLSLMPL